MRSYPVGASNMPANGIQFTDRYIKQRQAARGGHIFDRERVISGIERWLMKPWHPKPTVWSSVSTVGSAMYWQRRDFARESASRRRWSANRKLWNDHLAELRFGTRHRFRPFVPGREAVLIGLPKEWNNQTGLDT